MGDTGRMGWKSRRWPGWRRSGKSHRRNLAPPSISSRVSTAVITQIDAPEDAGRVLDARRQPVLGGAGHLGLKELHAAHAEQGQDGQRRTMIPMPPSQWVVARQNSTLFGSTSMPSKMVEPVVVKPDIDSKKHR